LKALVLEAASKLVMKNIPIPVPNDNEVLVRTKAATICTSDVNDILYNPFGIELPMIMGHEGAGIIEAVGANVTEFSVGDEIAAHPVMPCGECVSCKRGLSHLCDDMEHLGLNHGGVFAEYFTIRKDRIRKKADNIDFATASLMEPLCVCIEAVKRANVENAQNILVIGDGPFGILISNICGGYSDKKTILLGRHDFRMSHTKNVITVNEKTCGNVIDEINRITNGEGIDSAIICAGTNQAMNTAIESLRSRGTVCVFSAIHEPPAIDLFKVHVKELNICGSCNDMDCLDESMALLSDGYADGIITHKLPFDEFEKAFDIAVNGKDSALKISLIFGG